MTTLLDHSTSPDKPGTPACDICSYPRPEDGCRLCAGKPARLGARFGPFDVMRGFGLYWRAAGRVVNESTYLGKIVWAIGSSTVLLLALLALAVFVLHPWLMELLAWLPHSDAGALDWVLTISTCFFLFPVVLTLFLFPALDPLTRRAEAEALGFEPPPHRRGPIADFWDSMDTAGRIFAFQIVSWIVTLPLLLIFWGFPLAILAGAFFAGFAWLDYPASRRELTFAHKWRLARRHWALLVGFGLGFLTGSLIPFFNPCLVGPAGAVGAADLWFALDKRPAA